MSKMPAMQWYLGDYQKDPGIQKAHILTRGVWREILDIMWEELERGVTSGTVPQLARAVRCTEEEFAEALQEIEDLDIGTVTHRHKIVTLTNRRMVRDEKKRKSNADRQKRHRGKPDEDCHADSNANVTSPSSSSSSSSPSGDTKRGWNPLEAELPQALNTEAFRTSWGDWVEHRKEIKKKLTKTSVRQQLKTLEALGEKEAIATIAHTIGKGWTGLRQEDSARGTGGDGPKPAWKVAQENEKAHLKEYSRQLRAHIGCDPDTLSKEERDRRMSTFKPQEEGHAQ